MLLPALFLAMVVQDAPAPSPVTVQEGSPSAAAAAIDAGLANVKKRRLRQAEADFERAVGADPGSAAAHFYLGYTVYKRTEPARRLTPEKQRAAELFARCYSLDPAFRPLWGQR